MKIKAVIDDGSITLWFSAADREAVDRLPAAYRNTAKLPRMRMFPATLAIMLRIGKAFGDRVDWADKWNFRQWLERYELAKRMKTADELPEIPGGVIESWIHQRRGFWFVYHMRAAMLAHSMGLGKSKTILDLIRTRRHKLSLIVTTSTAVHDWPIHVRKHWPADTPAPLVLVLDADNAGDTAGKAQAVRDLLAIRRLDEWLIIVVSYSSVWRDPLGAVLCQCGLDFACLDESQHASSAGGKRGKFMAILGRRVRYRLCTSGTALKHRWPDLFAQYRFLDPGVFGTSEKDYLNRYGVWNMPEFVDDGTGKMIRNPKLGTVRRFIVDVQRIEELSNLFHSIAHHVPPGVVKLPEPVYSYRYCQLKPAARRLYDEFEDEFITEVDGATIEATNVLAKLSKLEQMANGFIGENIIDPDTGDIDAVKWHPIGDEKETLLSEVLNEIDPSEPVVVFCRFRYDLEAVRRVCANLKRPVLEQSGRKKERIQWQESSGGEVLDAQIQSACEAIDLTRSRYFIFYSIGFSLPQYEQAIFRGVRPGQTRNVFLIHLIANETVDERKYAGIRNRSLEIRDIIAGTKNAKRRSFKPGESLYT